MKVKIYTKGELAKLYFPHLSPQGARKKLKNWIKYSRLLTKELEAAGYDPKKHIFTMAQVELIFKHFGEP